MLSNMSGKKMTMGVIIGNRGFFPGELAKSGREEMIQALAKAGIDWVVLGPEDSKHGAVETHDEAKRCAALFRKNSDRLDGVIVSLPNFGDERAIADTLRLARLDVPVLVQATPDDATKMTILHRRDSFCGKMSACNNLRQYGIPYSLTQTAHGEPRLRTIFRMTWHGLPRCAAWPTACATCASAASARAPLPSIPFATAKSFSKLTAFRPRPSICRKSSAASPN